MWGRTRLGSAPDRGRQQAEDRVRGGADFEAREAPRLQGAAGSAPWPRWCSRAPCAPTARTDSTSLPSPQIRRRSTWPRVLGIHLNPYKKIENDSNNLSIFVDFLSAGARAT